MQPLLLLLRLCEDKTAVKEVSLRAPHKRESDRPDIAGVVLEGHSPVSGPVVSPLAMR